jgi:short-subunit dehydrogenase
MKVGGRTCVLTGATGGIGAAVARELARRRARLVLVARDEARASRLAGELEATGAEAHVLIGDILDPALPARLSAFAGQRAGGIDLLVNCAGRQSFGFFADETAKAAEDVLRVNTIAPMALTNAVLPAMIRRGHGQIVNVGSIFGSIGFPCFAAYSASKFALRGFSEALRRELAGSGVTITYVAPRFTRTPFNDGAVAAMAEALGMNQDEPESVARELVDMIERDGQNRYLGWPEKLFVRINALLPRLVDGALMRQVEKMRPFAARDAGAPESFPLR